MELTLPEKIQLLRKRMGLNQGQFGAKAFNTSVETGRTKIKNIELGKQKPTADDLAQMSKVLEVSPSTLSRAAAGETPSWRFPSRGCSSTRRCWTGFTSWALILKCSTGPFQSRTKS
jgi:transcriptional regulator with XRE-family HTH domain